MRASEALMDLTPDATVLATLAYTTHRGCVVYVGGRAMSPSDGDWATYLRFVRRGAEENGATRALVLERVYGPTLLQRQMLQAATATIDVRAAIMTQSPFTRGITVMVALVQPGYKAFAAAAFDDALAHLRIPKEHVQEFRNVVTSLEAKLERRRRQVSGSPLV
jgi:hypothetical protein